MKPLLRPAGRALRRLSLVAGLGAGLLLSGCIDSNSECIEDQPGYEEGKDVWLSVNFRNVDSEGRSRAVTDQDHPDEEATAAENYINGNDLNVMFLNSDGRVMKVFADGEYSVEVISNADGLYNDYQLNFRINQDYFEKTGATSTFSLLVVANHKGTGDGQTYNPDNLWMKSVADLSALKTSFGYTGQNGTEAWTPDIAGGRHIPMAGIHRFTVRRAALESATDANNPLVITDGDNEIDMQRAMAKIRVIDAFKSATDNVDGEYIASVKLKGVSSRGSFVPDDATWANGTCVLEKATWLTSWYQQENSISLTAPEEYTDTETNTLRTRMIGYMPECGSEVFNETQSPTLEIVVANEAGQTRNYSVKLSDIQNPGVTAFARNHIYQFIVEKNFQADITIAYTVCEWNSADADIDFN